MKTKKLFAIKTLLILCLLLPSYAMAKEQNERQKRAEEVMNNTNRYIYGTGRGDDHEEAYHAALLDMVRKISVTVSGNTITELENTVGTDGKVSSSELFKSVVESYTTPASLEGVEVIDLDEGDGFTRFVYMPKENIEKMHTRRRNNIADLARTGIRARDHGKVDDALRHLYRAYVLLQSLPAPSEVVENVDGEDRVLANWLPEAMRDIVNKVSFGIASVKTDDTDPDQPGKNIELTVNYDGKPVTTCTFKYGTSTGYSPLITARNGMALIELGPGVPMNPLKLYVEYMFKSENHANAELKPLLDTFKGAGVIDNRILLNDKKENLKAEKSEAKAFQKYVAAGANEGVVPMDKKDSKPFAAAVDRILKSISTGNYSGIDTLFTPDGRKVFDRLISYGKAKILGKATRDTYDFYPFREKIVCRSVPMAFSFENGRQNFTEEVVFTFNSDCKLENVTFGLGNTARNDIFAKEGAAWTDYKKMTLVNFLENYRTAFALKELDYIESIFDDNAVIIIGNVTSRLERVPGSSDNMAFVSRDKVNYIRKTKSQYLDQLRRCFSNQDYISVRFSDTDVERSGVGGETYAIQLQQDYISQTYGDQGYLFLFVDFNDEDRPMIHVRTWQPERNPDLTPNLPLNHPNAGIFTPSSF